MKKPRLVTGIQPTNHLTLGNYLGVIKNLVKLQDKYEVFIFIADLHSLTVEDNSKKLLKNRLDLLIWIISLGIDLKKSHVFFQSEILEHTYLCWLLTNQTMLGDLNRMTQFKDKISSLKEKNNTQKIPSGLLFYPILMAADILLYNADFVLIGKDQKQHLELTRNLAIKFQKKYQINIKIPEILIFENVAKICSLTDPEKKMSKSDQNKNSSIFLSDDPEKAKQKILKSKTDSENKIYLSNDKPGIKNLLTIYSALKEIDVKEAETFFADKNYLFLKQEVAILVKNFLEKIQINYYKNQVKIKEILANLPNQKIQKIARLQIEEFKQKMGL